MKLLSTVNLFIKHNHYPEYEDDRRLFRPSGHFGRYIQEIHSLPQSCLTWYFKPKQHNTLIPELGEDHINRMKRYQRGI